MRGVFNLRNVRDYLLILIFIRFFKEEFLTSKVHTLFTYFFTISVALRVGFYDFSILAARLPTVFSFTEIFLLPLILGKITPQSTRVVFLTLWMFFNLSIFFTIVYPIEQFISDYLG